MDQTPRATVLIQTSAQQEDAICLVLELTVLMKRLVTMEVERNVGMQKQDSTVKAIV